MKRIAIFQTDLQIGGIQNSLISLLNELSREDLLIDVYLGEIIEPHPEWTNIKIMKMHKHTSLFKYIPFSIAYVLKKSSSAPKIYDLAIDYNGYSVDTALGALSCEAKNKVIWIHSDYAKRLKYNSKFRILWSMMKKKYSRFNQAVVVSPGAEESFKSLVGDIISTQVISNLTDSEKILRQKEELISASFDSSKYHLVTMGRMVYSKGFDILLELFSDVVKQRTDMMLHFIGDGEEKEKLEARAKRLGLEKHVVFWGNQKNPYAIMDHMDGFVFTPRYEGQGLVLIEAKILGLEIFTTREMEKFNVLVSGVDDLEEALIKATKEPKAYQLLQEYNDKVRKDLHKLIL